MKRINLKVDGITCSGCAVDVATALKDKDGIADAEANYAEGTLSVEYHPEEIDERAVLDIVKKLGLKFDEVIKSQDLPQKAQKAHR